MSRWNDGFCTETLAQIYSSTCFVEDNLHSLITVQDMADEAGFSLFHFSRVFNQAVHHSPYDFLIRRRLSDASGEVAAGSRSLTDIALDYCFQTPEGFARAFRRMFGVLPSTARKIGHLDTRIVLAPVTEEYLEVLSSSRHFSPEQVTLQENVVYGNAARSPLESFARDLFSRRTAEKIVVDFPPDWREQGLQLLRGTSSEPFNNALWTTVVAGEYAQFSFAGETRIVECFMKYLYSTFCPRNDTINLPDRVYLETPESGGWSAYIPLA